MKGARGPGGASADAEGEDFQVVPVESTSEYKGLDILYKNRNK